MNQTAQLMTKRYLTDHVIEILIKPETPIEYQPGQWLSLGLPVGPRQPLKRAYSMASPMRSDGSILLIFDCVPNGLGSNYLASLEVGDTVQIITCTGFFVLPEDVRTHLVFVARYTGLVPILALLKSLEQQNYTGQVRLIYSSPTESEFFYLEELTALNLPDFSFGTMCLDEYEDERPEEAAALAECKALDSATTDIFICGVGRMVKPIKRTLTSEGFDRKRIHVQRYC